MKGNKFFRLVWRVNGVAMMLLLLIIIGFAAYSFIRDMVRPDHTAAITNVAVDPQGEEKWTLGSPVNIEGTPLVYIPLVSEKRSIALPTPGLSALHSYGGDYFSPSRNLLFVNKRTREMKWLFKDNRQLISNIDLLSAQKEYDKDRVVDAILYQVIGTDTNGDKKLTAEDLADVAVSRPDGGGFKEVIPAIERLIGAMSVEGRELLVIYQFKGMGYASTIRLQDMSVQGTSEMPRVEPAP